MDSLEVKDDILKDGPNGHVKEDSVFRAEVIVLSADSVRVNWTLGHNIDMTRFQLEIVYSPIMSR